MPQLWMTALDNLHLWVWKLARDDIPLPSGRKPIIPKGGITQPETKLKERVDIVFVKCPVVNVQTFCEVILGEMIKRHG